MRGGRKTSLQRQQEALREAAKESVGQKTQGQE